MSSCTHVAEVREEIQPISHTCVDCEKEGKTPVALRLCLTCGYVGCCDSSEGRHARRHYEETGHPIITDLPKRSWKWCYVDNTYL